MEPHTYGLFRKYAGVVDHVAGREVVGAVDDQVVVLEDLEDVVVVEPHVVQDHLDERVDLGDRLPGRLGLRPADVGLPVDDLALQVRLVDLVELDDAERADAGGGEVEQRRAAQAARADDEHLGVLEPLLPGHADVGDDQVAAVAAYLVDGQLVGRLDQGGRDTTASPCMGSTSGLLRHNTSPADHVPRPGRTRSTCPQSGHPSHSAEDARGR